MKIVIKLIIILFLVSCSSKLEKWKSYDESKEISNNSSLENQKLRYKRIQSISTDKNNLIHGLENEIENFIKTKYDKLKSKIVEKTIPEIQQSIINNDFSYHDLTLFYISRIYLIEFNKETYLNSIISINKDVLDEAKLKDSQGNSDIYSVFGIPILLKDNIGFESLPTTAGAHSLQNNYTKDAYIVEKLKEKGALILGKTNLSEWANYFCSGCPNGYTAMGGQTLNPYGRKIIDTGGSSSGSGAATTSNLTAVSLGSETSGSILSPSSASSLVGMKPTIGNVSRSGIIPISSTLDTAGPMTKNIIDNIIVYNAINEFDSDDSYSKENLDIKINDVLNFNPSVQKIGYYSNFYENDIMYKDAIDFLIESNIQMIEISAPKVNLNGFVKILDEDMRVDLKKYFLKYGNEDLKVNDIKSIIEYNNLDSIERSPYGQGIFKKIINDTMSKKDFLELKSRLMVEGNKFYNLPMDKHKLDAVLSVNNYHAGYAAVAHNPALTVPMGLRESNEPAGLTFVGKSNNEQILYELGYYFELNFSGRIPPENSN
ncbi:MAG: amidase [Flavobacteriales bacterium]|nr:amidase [Flavobacteriales bacterium]